MGQVFFACHDGVPFHGVNPLHYLSYICPFVRQSASDVLLLTPNQHYGPLFVVRSANAHSCNWALSHTRL